MKSHSQRIKKLAENFAALLEHEQRACQVQIHGLIDALKLLQGDTADRRFLQLTLQLKALQQRLHLLGEMGRGDLAKIAEEAATLAQDVPSARLAQLITSMMETPALALNPFCERLLDQLIDITPAERGFVLFYLPESTQADVIAARNFQTCNLALDEYDFSRTLLRQVFRQPQALLIEDASQDPNFAQERSVIAYQLKSVLLAPLKQHDRVIGALYLENNARPGAFDDGDLQLLRAVAAFAVFCLERARLLPVTFAGDRQIFLDTSKAATEIIGRDAKILSLLDTIKRIADSPATVLIGGESGTGKELFARALHEQSARRDKPFVAINCAAIPDELLESELFGHEKGAFTGATERYLGRIERGDGGTIFLDEVSELAYPLQAKLLRFLQASEFDRLGGKEPIQVDVRIIAATSRDLQVMTEAGKFQDALYYRLNVIPLVLPALKERRGDIVLLARHFLEKFSAIYKRQLMLEAAVYALLQEYAFPGNVRELENVIHRLVALASDDLIRVGDLPAEILQTHAQRVSLQRDSLDEIFAAPVASLAELRERQRQLRRVVAEQELALVERAITEARGNLTEAASKLGIHRITLHKILRKNNRQADKKTPA